MSVWQYVKGDTYGHGRLQQIKKVTEDNLKLANKNLLKFKSFEKYGLPNYRFNLLRRMVRVEELIESLVNIDMAITDNQEIKDRDIDIATHSR